MSDGLRARRNMVVGAALFLFCAYMLLVAGHLKKVYEDWTIQPQHHTAEEAYAARNWPQVDAFQRDHPILWEIAPLSPPYGWNNRSVWLTWLFVKVNWRFLAYLIRCECRDGNVRVRAAKAGRSTESRRSA
jgi:hypothetical protein